MGFININIKLCASYKAGEHDLVIIKDFKRANLVNLGKRNFKVDMAMSIMGKPSL
jgi:hypothetical protein